MSQFDVIISSPCSELLRVCRAGFCMENLTMQAASKTSSACHVQMKPLYHCQCFLLLLFFYMIAALLTHFSFSPKRNSLETNEVLIQAKYKMQEVNSFQIACQRNTYSNLILAFLHSPKEIHKMPFFVHELFILLFLLSLLKYFSLRKA